MSVDRPANIPDTLFVPARPVLPWTDTGTIATSDASGNSPLSARY